ncbi:hypothetical protein BH11CYA1_BH11CYA1_15380 [soil metagenome]
MNNKYLLEAIRIAFSIVSLTFLAPALLPGVEYNGGFVVAAVLGSLFHGYQNLWRIIVNPLLGVANGTCPMPGMMKWLLLSTVVGIVLFIGALGLLLPAVYAVHGVFSAIFAGLIVTVGMMLANIPTRLLERFSK